MPNYVYRALSLNGRSQQGKEVADSLNHLRDILAARDLILKSAHKADGAFRIYGRKLPLNQFAGFNQQFAVLLRAGISIPEALGLLKNRPGQSNLENAIGFLLEDVRRGSALSDAAAKLHPVFEPAYCATIAVGEQSGQLPQSLEHYQRGLILRLKLRNQLSKALLYPTVLMLTLAGVLIFLFLVVIPSFVAMYRDLGNELPEITQALIFIAENFQSIAVSFAVAVLTLFLIDHIWSRKPDGVRQKHELLQKLPLLGPFRRVAAASEAARILSTLVLSGTTIARAFAIASQSLSDRYFAAVLGEVNQAILVGERASEALRRWPLFPSTSLKMLAAGEESGSLDRMLTEIATFHEAEVEQSLQRLTTLIEPVLTLIAGLIVGGVIVAMYLPMFSLMETIR